MLRRSLRNTRRYRPANEHAKPPVRRRRRRRAFPAARRLRRIDALDTYRAPAAADMPKPMQRRAQMLGWSTPRTFRRDQLSVGLRPRHIFMTTAVTAARLGTAAQCQHVCASGRASCARMRAVLSAAAPIMAAAAAAVPAAAAGAALLRRR